MSNMDQINVWLKKFDGKVIKSIELRDYFGEKQVIIFFTNNQRLILSDTTHLDPTKYIQFEHVKHPGDISGRAIEFTYKPNE